MKSVDAHLADCLEPVSPLSPLSLQLLDALGCSLAEDVVAPYPLPPFDNSAMDGYAVRAEDVTGATEDSPVVLPVTGDLPAGVVSAYALTPGSAVRIMTGAPVPAGADAIVPVELTDQGIARVSVKAPVEVGRHIRRSGDDVSAGDVVLAAGTRLGPRHLGLLAAVGRDRVLARPRPRVVVLSTGSELVEPGQHLGSGQINESNSFMLTAAAQEAGATAFRVGIVADEPQALMNAIEDQLIRADLVITTGGVSKGAYDVVKEVLGRLGTVSFDAVAMQPGLPQGRGTIGPDETPILTFPGNPVSAYVSFEVFGRPVLRKMLGSETLTRPEVRAVCLGSFSSPEGKRQFARGVLSVEEGRYVVRPVTGQASHHVRALGDANAFIVVPEAVTRVVEGSPVTVMVLERRGI
ncbi:MAG TPA: gephyrin-like molybdotransferase Glp [Actinomycetes bacterium]|nr:gephyrin-like molybdotransferase Glp [Actinomycetes bacterium]